MVQLEVNAHLVIYVLVKKDMVVAVSSSSFLKEAFKK